MTAQLQQLVHDTVHLTGARPPDLLDGKSPTLTESAVADGGLYLVGLIGGKEVGKSALVNALVGQPITRTTAFGPGTDSVIAYAHESAEPDLHVLLQREVPGQFRIVTHQLEHLRRQVLVDLPDIDSHWASHVKITRQMLRHMLYPIWVQSIEKYADLQPQQLLATVATGNAAGNFLFALNKTDQLRAAEGDDAVVELRDDFAGRVARTLGIDTPRVWMLSATHPELFDLPDLRQVLSRQKADDLVRSSQQLAVRQQDKSLSGWLAKQDLAGRAERANRLVTEAEELLGMRIGVPLLEQSLPALMDDPASRLALTDEVMSLRVARWPMVNLVQTVLTPVLAIVRRNVGATRSAGLPDAEALVQAHLQPRGVQVATLLRTVFAQLQQSQPDISRLYTDRKLWEDMYADTAAAMLRDSLTDAVAYHRQQVRKKLAGGRGMLTAPFRWLLTIGMLIWFPLAQPVVYRLLTESISQFIKDLPLWAVQTFSVEFLLQNLTFLSMYFFVLWVILRWCTQRRIARFSTRWKTDSSIDSPSGRVAQWMDDLLMPIHSAAEEANDLASRAKAIAIP